MYLRNFTFGASDIISPEQAQQEAAKARDVLRILKGLETEQLKMEGEKISTSPNMSDVIYLLLRIEERIIQLEAKLDSLLRR
ncbi:MAG: hypothetical protein QXJ68_00200 [Methanocellales archaeon]